MAGVKETTLRVAGCGVSVKRAGQGAPLLFLHGGGGAPRWLPFMTSLAERFDVIVPEHPGFGKSETPEWLDTIGDLAFFYLDFIKQLGLERVHLVGSSMGGWIAAELAVRLKYAGVPSERLHVVPGVAAGLDEAVAGATSGRLYALPTYTALLELRGVLADRGQAVPFWEPARV